MKKVFILLLMGIVIFCNAQNNIANNMETYNFELMNKNRKINPYGMVQNNTKFVMYHMTESGALTHEYPPLPCYYKIIKEFYPNGNLKVIETKIGKFLSIEETIIYDEQRNRIKIDEENKFGKLKLKDLLEFVEKEGIIDLGTGEGLETVEIREDGRVQPVPGRFEISSNIIDNIYWIITITAQPWNNWAETIYHLDKDTGEILFKESTEKFPVM